MAGTLIASLEARGIAVTSDSFVAEVAGTNEMVDGMPTLTKVHVHYRFEAPKEKREAAERALAKHRDKCPTARSLQGAIAIEYSAEIIER